MKTTRLGIFTGFAAAALFILAPQAHADLKQMKAYKEAYPDSKLKCVDCHAEAKPSKDDGQHELNDYGKTVKALVKPEVAPTADEYKKAGKIEDFTKK